MKEVNVRINFYKHNVVNYFNLPEPNYKPSKPFEQGPTAYHQFSKQRKESDVIPTCCYNEAIDRASCIYYHHHKFQPYIFKFNGFANGKDQLCMQSKLTKLRT